MSIFYFSLSFFRPCILFHFFPYFLLLISMIFTGASLKIVHHVKRGGGGSSMNRLRFDHFMNFSCHFPNSL
ncbi:hypothetical protein VNO77_24365 [Canavalia gladiata]|uniref:Uncharacterized protein n=1 Tax=Canavalia gladiata TaxID=3824 RepID=A0AAN9L9F6_CANGL